MALILNIETSTDVCSICLARDGKMLGIKESQKAYSHNEMIAVFIKELLESSDIQVTDIDAIAISKGPGSYTSLRIGTSTAKGMCYALDIPLISVDSLLIIAAEVKDQSNKGDIIVPMIDARRNEVYQAIYDSHLDTIANVAPLVLEKDSYDYLNIHEAVLFCGNGATKAKEILSLQNGVFIPSESSSKGMISIAEEKFNKKLFEDIIYYEPNYYKGANINVQKKNILR